MNFVNIPVYAIRSISLLLFSFSLLSCHQTRIIPLAAPRNGQTRNDVYYSEKSYLLGYYEGAARQADCRDGIESIRIRKDAMDSVIYFFLGGFYTTRTVEVKCVRPHLDREDLTAYKSFVLHGVYFDSNSSKLQGDSDLILDELALFLKDNAALNIRIIGHTDLIGGARENEKLSVMRAIAAKEYLVSRGVTAERIVTEGKGAREPVIKAYDEDSSAINRRIEIVALKTAVLSRAPQRKTAGVTEAAGNIPPDGVPPAQGTVPGKGLESDSEWDARIILLDGSILKGNIVDQTRERIIVNVHGQQMIFMKSQVRRIVYHR